MRIALLTYDSRETSQHACFERPLFGSAPAALLQGFVNSATTLEFELDVLSFARRTDEVISVAPGIRVHTLALPWDGRLRFGYMGQFRAIRRKMRKMRPDLVHAQGMEDWCALVGALMHGPKLLTIHGYLPLIMKNSPMGTAMYVRSRMGTWSIPRYDGIVCISRHIEGLVSRVAKRTVRIPNAVDEEFFATPVVRRENRSEPQLIVVGTVCPNKSQVEIMDMLSRLANSGRSFKARFFGELGSHSDYNSRFLRAVGLNSTFAEYCGHLLRSDLIRELDASDALVHAPKEEAFGLVVAEAVVRRLRTFCFDVGGLADAGANGGGGTFIERDRWDLMERELSAWLDSGAPKLDGDVDRERFRPATVARAHLDAYRTASENFTGLR